MVLTDCAFVGLTADKLAQYINESRATNARVIPLITEHVSNKGECDI